MDCASPATPWDSRPATLGGAVLRLRRTLRRVVRRPAGGIGETILRCHPSQRSQGAVLKTMRLLAESTTDKYVLRNQR